MIKEKQILDKGFIQLVNFMGDDQAIVDAARVSYGKGTKSVNDDAGLIRYLMRHKHTTPFEMVEFKFCVKAPLFVAAQWIRHRTANVNQLSARYSIVEDEFYLPEPERVRLQSQTNKQGSSDNIAERDSAQFFINSCKDLQNIAYNDYIYCTEKENIARELTRIMLPQNTYTSWYWKIDLHNLLHFLQLRMDNKAQYEIKQYADAMYEMIKNIVPVACEAFENYRLNSKTISGEIWQLLLQSVDRDKFNKLLEQSDIISKGEKTENYIN